jgi:hypothetical protein
MAIVTSGRVARVVLLVIASACGGETSAPAPAPATPAPATPAPTPAPPPAVTITQVEILVQPANGGSASCEFHADGAVTGGHLSGDNPPFVHQDTGRIADPDRARMWAAAEAVVRELGNGPPSATPEGRGTITLVVTKSDASMVRRVWPFGTEPTEPSVKALHEIVMAHHIGGW